MSDVPGTLQGDYSNLYSSDVTHSGNDGLDFLSALGQTPIGNLFVGDYGANQQQAIISENAANNAFVRDMMKLQEQNIYNSSEAAKDRDFQSAEAKLKRDWDEHMRDTAYQATVKDMKASGINPVLAYQQGATSSGSGASASGSRASSGSGGSSSGSYSGHGYKGEGLATIAKIIAGCISAGASEAVAGINAAASVANSSRSRHTVSYKRNGRYYTDSYSD